MKSKTKRFLVILTVVVIVAAITAIAVSAAQFNNYRKKKGNVKQTALLPTVVISSPEPGVYNPDGEIGANMVKVFVNTAGPNPILSTELWINGVLSGIDGIPGEGQASWQSIYTWLPARPGVYSLVATAVDDQGNKVFSNPVPVVLKSPETVNVDESSGAGSDSTGNGGAGEADQGDTGAAAGYQPVVHPSEGLPQPPPNMVPLNTTITPSEPWQGSIGEWWTSMTNDLIPTAPELVVEAGNCGANLFIHDRSDNEEGFRIYRNYMFTVGFDLIAELSSNPGQSWLSYSDPEAAGGVTYVVEAFTSKGSTPSNFASVNAPLEDCEYALAPKLVASIKLGKLAPKPDVDKTYCYKTFGGDYWSRSPDIGFYNDDSPKQLATFNLKDENGNQVAVTKDLELDCWGWQGDALISLGRLTFDGLSSENPGKHQVSNENLTAEVIVDKWEFLNPPMIPMGGGGGPEVGLAPDYEIVYNLAWDDDLWDIIFSHDFFTNDKMPIMSTKITYDLDECKAHLPAWFGGLNEDAHCFIYSAYTSEGGTNPQPYLVWYYDDNYCPASIEGVGDCLPVSNWIGYADHWGGSVEFMVTEPFAGGFNNYYESIMEKTVFVIPPKSCNDERTFVVSLYYHLAGVSQYGLGSFPVKIPCEPW